MEEFVNCSAVFEGEDILCSTFRPSMTFCISSPSIVLWEDNELKAGKEL